jgi:hypothetical protein
VVLEILNGHELNGPDFFVLSYIKHHGQAIPEGRAVLLSDLHDKLQQASGKSQGAASRAVTDLMERDLVRKIGITRASRQSLFPDGSGQHTVVVVTAEGLKLLDDINAEAGRLIDHLVGGLAKPLVKVAVKAVAKHSTELTRRLGTWKR